MIDWIFDNPRRMRRVALGIALAVLFLFLTATVARLKALPTLPAVTASTSPATTTTPQPQASRSQAFSASPTPDYGSSLPIALEAVQAFLDGDHAKYSSLASQQAAEDANDAVVDPGQVLTGAGKILLGGPTRQKVQVPTSMGKIILNMVEVDGAWTVDSMEMAK